jgi:hypothetical protein
MRLLRRVYVTDLLKRSRLMETGPEAFVLALSPDQRAAWLDSMIDAEGHRQTKIPVSGASRGAGGEFVRIAQVNGPLQNAIKLAVFLEGYRPTFSALSAESKGYKPSGQVGMARPHIAPSMFAPHEVLERQTVWCVTAELGTWTTKGSNDLPFLTGNSNAACGDPSKGLLAPPGHHHEHVPASSAHVALRGQGLMNLTNCLPKSVVSRPISDVGETDPDRLAASIPAELSSLAMSR